MPFYKPVETARAFRIGKPYYKIDWNNFREVLNEFHGRIDDWYIKPAKELGKNGDFAFPVMAIDCMLIDTLSQYYYGAGQSPNEKESSFPSSSRSKFKDFLKERLPQLTGPLPTPIQQPPMGKKKTGDPLNNFEDVLYSGFRCGILHQSHIPLYGVIYGIPTALEFRANGATTYADGKDCPTVICFPQKLLDELETAFIKYLDDLWDANPAFDDLRRRFKAKFEDSFGVTINTTIKP